MFDKHENLWVEICDRRVPPHLLIKRPDIFMAKFKQPERLWISLTAYIKIKTRLVAIGA